MQRTCQQCKHDLSFDKFVSNQKRCKVCSNSRKKSIIYCEAENCNKRCSFGLITEKITRWCAEHKDPRSINLKSKRCEFINCNTIASYGSLSDRKKRWCAKHKDAEALNLTSNKCSELTCLKQASFGFEKDGIKLWCIEHKHQDAVAINHKKCETNGCRRQPIFGNTEEGFARWCSEHKENNSVDLKNKHCEEPLCNKIAAYGDTISNKRRWCSKHKPQDSIDLINKKCEKEGCNKIPYFNLAGNTIGKWCFEHKDILAVDVKSKKCEICGKTATFGLIEENITRWCSAHKNEKAIDLKHPKCIKCGIRATYNMIGCIPSRCSHHKENGMFPNPTVKCLTRNCKNLATYGCSRRQIHCEEHKTDNDILLSERKCSNCGAIDILTEKGICVSYCSADEKFKEYKKHEKKDEKRILKLLTEEFGEPTSYDKMVINDCGYRERPDIVYDVPESKVRIIIEIDENGDKHTSSSCNTVSSDENELNRMINIFNSFAETTHTIFIRYNPNIFYNRNIKNKTTKSQRETILVKWIDKIINNKPNIFNVSPLAVLYLFYNEYIPSSTDFKMIDIMHPKIYYCDYCFQIHNEYYDKLPRGYLLYHQIDFESHKLKHK